MFGAIFFTPLFVSAQVPDQILDLTVTATIDENGSTHIEEVILYDFGPKRLHGIFRNIPLQAQEGSIIRNFGIKDITVTDRDGNAIPVTTSNEKTYLRLKIGNPDVLVTGAVEYHISYTASTIMRGFSKSDEWLWDVTSSNWPVPILRARVNIVFPKSISIQELVRSCVTIPPGTSQGKETCQVGFIDRSENGVTPSIQAMDLNMAPKESMLIGLGFPKGFIKNVPITKQPVRMKVAPLTEVLPATLMVVLLGFGVREILRRKWPHVVRE